MESNEPLFGLSIDPVTKAHLADTARWARFLALVGLVVLFLGMMGTLLSVTVLSDSMSVSYIVYGNQSDSMSNSLRIGTIVFILIISAIAFFPLWFLFQFSNKMKKALASNEQAELNDSFQNLKKHFRYLGIIVIIILVVYAFLFLLAIISMAALG